MIPKKIHYCWFGQNPKPNLAQKCLRSWKKYCFDYEIIEWNEDNFDIASCPLYVRQAYQEKMWAFVTDYARLYLVYTYGGIYLDTDVELLASLDKLLQHRAYFGFEDGRHINTGHGFGAEKGHPVVKAMMDDYNDILFILADGTYDRLPCPQRNTTALLSYGLVQDNTEQLLDEGIKIFPSEWFCPVNYGVKTVTKNTMSIHWFGMSWKTEEEQRLERIYKHKHKIHATIDRVLHIPNALMKAILGGKRYEAFKNKFKR